MKVYHSGSYGRANLMVRPGLEEPHNEHWFEIVADEYGEPRRRARNILVQFDGGVAETDDELAHYLLEKNLASAEPLEFAPPPRLEPREQWDEVYPPAARKPPIAVGSPLPPDQILERSPW